MKKIYSIVFLLLVFSFVQLFSQNFSKYTTFTGEKHIWPGLTNEPSRLPFKYDQIFDCVSSYSTGKYIDSIRMTPSINVLVKNNNNDLYIYSIESYGYRILDPKIKYNDARIVNAQEGLNLDTFGNAINGSIALSHANTEHPTIERFRDNQGVFSNIDNINHTLSGNFYGSAKSELMFIYDKADSA